MRNEQPFQQNKKFKNALLGTAVAGGKIEIVPEEVEYLVSQDLLNAVNDKYDNKDLLQEIGGMLHTLPECREHRRLRCIQIYGKEI